jgi:PAS domain S-box-containing protein
MTSTASLSFDDVEAILAAVPDIVILVSPDDRIRYINRVMPGYDRSEVMGRSTFEYVQPEHRELMRSSLEKVRESGESVDYEVASVMPDGGYMWWASRMAPIRTEEGLEVLIVARDVTQLRLAEESRRTVEAELEKVMDLLPICAWCKRVRDDTGYWEEVGAYISERTGAEVTHGICPDCLAELEMSGERAGPP